MPKPISTNFCQLSPEITGQMTVYRHYEIRLLEHFCKCLLNTFSNKFSLGTKTFCNEDI